MAWLSGDTISRQRSKQEVERQTCAGMTTLAWHHGLKRYGDKEKTTTQCASQVRLSDERLWDLNQEHIKASLGSPAAANLKCMKIYLRLFLRFITYSRFP